MAKTTPVSVIAGIAYIAVENIKVMKRFADGELTAAQMLDNLRRNTVAVLGSLVVAGKGASIGVIVG